MTADRAPYADFRLELNHETHRAQALLAAARSGDAGAIARLRATQTSDHSEPAALELAAARNCIARELRLPDWRALERHVETLTRLRTVIATDTGAPDADSRTLHVRCGHDIESALRAGGFRGAFHAHINPYHQGPVTATPNWLEHRAQFIAASSGPYLGLDYDTVLRGCYAEEEQLAMAGHDYDRVVLWLEHDRYDQFVLVRCLTAFAEHGAPATLELVGPGDFPGATRFVGLGQLPPEALRLLWERRRTLAADVLDFAAHAWRLFRASDPQPLAALASDGTPLLPDLAPALHRHLQELPAIDNGLGLTQQLLITTLAELGSATAGRLVELVMERDPLPGLGDLGYDQALRELEAGETPAVERTDGAAWRNWPRDTVTITAAGRDLLAGKRDWLATRVPERGVGGVQIIAGRPNWRWHHPGRQLLRK